MVRPNIFSFAQSELSQDAMIAWLASWAAPEYSDIDPALHHCGMKLLSVFYKKHKRILPEKIRSVKVETQTNRIDVLITVNGEEYIIVEDKTRTKEHGNQLAEYKKTVIQRKKASPEAILPIYFKTYEQSNYAKVRAAGYKIFSRGDFLSILDEGRKAGVSNEIFADFLAHLNAIEERVNAYQKMESKAWQDKKHWRDRGDWRDPWQGLFSTLQLELKNGNWGYVPNATGGFMGFWFGGRDVEIDEVTARAYLLLKEDGLCCNIAVKEKTLQKKFRSMWHKALISGAEPSEIALRKPARFGSGKNMTVAEAGAWLVNDNGRVDIPATVENLKRFMDFHDSIRV